jgi:hypothetical protein
MAAQDSDRLCFCPLMSSRLGSPLQATRAEVFAVVLVVIVVIRNLAFFHQDDRFFAFGSSNGAFVVLEQPVRAMLFVVHMLVVDVIVDDNLGVDGNRPWLSFSSSSRLVLESLDWTTWESSPGYAVML